MQIFLKYDFFFFRDFFFVFKINAVLNQIIRNRKKRKPAFNYEYDKKNIKKFKMKLDIFHCFIETHLKELFEMILIAFKSGKIFAFFIVILMDP